MEDIGFVSYADDNTTYSISDDIDYVVSTLEDAAVNLFK